MYCHWGHCYSLEWLGQKKNWSATYIPSILKQSVEGVCDSESDTSVCIFTEPHTFYPWFPIGREFSSVQSFSCIWLFATPWITAGEASLSITNSQSSPKPMSIESVMPSSHPILCHPLLLLPPIPPTIRVISNESTLLMRWPKYWSFSFSIIPSKEIPGLIFRMD